MVFDNRINIELLLLSIPRPIFCNQPYRLFLHQPFDFAALLQTGFGFLYLLQQIPGISIGGELLHQFATEGFGQQGLWQLLYFCFW